MNKISFSILFIFSLLLPNFSIEIGTKEEDEIQNLPGLEFAPNFNHYSGYLRVSPEHELFYWLVTSQHDSPSDPLIFWFNGGPGCSSLFGLLGEHGPYLLDLEGKTLKRNPNAWNRNASVVYIESPAGVGFSLAGESEEWNDRKTAKENYEAVKQFLGKFPEYRRHRIFITGESYAGIYLPTLAEQIIDGQREFEINFKGMAIGNGLVNWTLNHLTLPQFYYAHGFVDELQWEKMEEECNQMNKSNCANLIKNLGENEDGEYLGQINIYDIYGKCENNDDSGGLEGRQILQMMQKTMSDGGSVSMDKMPQHFVKHGGEQLIPCVRDYYSDYLNRQDVRKALHVADDVPEWIECNETVQTGYSMDYVGVEEQVKKTLNAGIPVLLFYGDFDIACNLLMGSKFAASLGYEVKKSAEPWTFNGQIGGFKTIYEGGLTFTTIRGAGHMAAIRKGPEILHAIEAFVKNEEF